MIGRARWGWAVCVVFGACQPGVGDDDAQSDTDLPVFPGAPSAPGVLVVPEAPLAFEQDLSCVVAPASEDADRTDLRFLVTWWRDGELFEGATTVLQPHDTVPASAVTAGSVWTCAAQPIDEIGVLGPIASASVRVAVPNVLLIVVDDLGVGDVSTYGGAVSTPHLDALASQGTRFTAGYVAAPACGPSRAGLVTGRQPSRTGVEFNLGNPSRVEEQRRGLPYDEVTVADVMSQAGLRTGLLGKWHLGFMPSHHPLARGFDEFFGFLSGQRYSIRPGESGAIDAWPFERDPPIWPVDHWADAMTYNGEPISVLNDEHLTDRFAREAINYFDRAQGDPFFLMLSFNAPHEPVQATAEMLARVPAEPDNTDQWAYRASVAGLDVAVGEVLAALDDSGLADDTLVVFLSDHGCNDYFGWCSNAPFAGGKLRLTEGGLRVPMMVRWPGRIAQGVVDDRMVSSMDWLPTFAAAVGTSLPEGLELDGVDLLPWLVEGQQGDPHEQLTWKVGTARAIRRGTDKLVQINDEVWVFDMADDVEEQHNLAADSDALVSDLLGRLDARESLFAVPMWYPQTTLLRYYDSDWIELAY